MKNTYTIIFLLLFLVSLLVYFKTSHVPSQPINSFIECSQQKNSTLSPGTPATCRTKNGRIFEEVVISPILTPTIIPTPSPKWSLLDSETGWPRYNLSLLSIALPQDWQLETLGNPTIFNNPNNAGRLEIFIASFSGTLTQYVAQLKNNLPENLNQTWNQQSLTVASQSASKISLGDSSTVFVIKTNNSNRFIEFLYLNPTDPENSQLDRFLRTAQFIASSSAQTSPL